MEHCNNKMSVLPFVVEPRLKPITEKIGTEESGIIEIERKGYLTTGEKAFVQQVQQFDNGTTEIVTVSRRIARKFSTTMDKAYRMVLFIVSGREAENEADRELANEIEKEFAEELTSIVKGLATGQTKEEMIMAACLIKYRIDMQFEINQIATIHPDIIAGLANLYREEDIRSIAAFQKEEEEEQEVKSIEEVEKKPKSPRRSPLKNTTGD